MSISFAPLACVTAALLSIGLSAQPARATEQSSAPVDFERLTFPETLASDAPKVDYVAVEQQPAVALPTPQFTGFAAIGALGVLLACRKSILRMVL